MATTQLVDVIVPVEFTDYIVANSVEKTAFWESGIAVRNALIESQLRAGADAFSVPIWLDLGNEEADAVNDDPDTDSVPNKLNAVKMLVRKSFLHNSWAAMNFASELSGDDALRRIQDRVTAYWARQWQRRLIATLKGVLADNVANDSGDMQVDISAEAGAAAVISPAAVIDTAGTLGDAAADLRAIAMHSDVMRKLMKDDAIEYIQPSQGSTTQIPTYRGLRVIADDSMPVTTGSIRRCSSGRAQSASACQHHASPRAPRSRTSLQRAKVAASRSCTVA